jgi:hypothetical protein
MLPLQPTRENALRSDGPMRWGSSWAQTFRTAAGERGALLWPDGDQKVYWVGGRLWRAYVEAGGPPELGPPCGERYDWGESIAQSFTKALLVCEINSGCTRVIWRGCLRASARTP